MFGFAVAECTTTKYLPALIGLLVATAVAVIVIIFMVHEGKRQTNKTLRAACIAGGIVLAPIIWFLIVAFVMPSGCL